jgi:hypothetical protein
MSRNKREGLYAGRTIAHYGAHVGKKRFHMRTKKRLPPPLKQQKRK